MKFIKTTSLFFLFFGAISCANNKPDEVVNDSKVKNDVAPPVVVTDTFEKGKLISPVVCKGNSAQTYALYIPAKATDKSLAVVYFFDPHGNGSLPLNKYKSLADLYGFILIGSNNSRNGNDWTTSEDIWNTLVSDSRARLKIDPARIYACGFSGGAKVACYVALNHHEIKGVIANGAGLPEMVKTNFAFGYTAIAGEGDMNMTDLVAINEELKKSNTIHRLIMFDGKHEWAPETTMNIAFAGFQFDAMRSQLIPVDKEFVSHFVTESRKRVANFSVNHNYIKAGEECELASTMLEGLTGEQNWFKEKEATLKNDPAYRKQLKARENLLASEQSMKAAYEQQFQQGDMNYWTKTIHDLQASSKLKTAEGAMYQRLIAYLSLAFYSISNQFIAANRDKEAQYFVELYKMDDPSNSEAWYFSAILNARNKNPKATEDDLKQAIATGFGDKDRLLQQPEFKTIQINMSEIIGKMN